MFRKPKKGKTKAGIRKRKQDDEDENDDDLETTRQELQQAKKLKNSSLKAEEKTSSGLPHHFDTEASQSSQQDLVTSTSQHHPTKVKEYRNKLLAGPIRAASNIRTTCRFDYQPDICKDYKDTGFCGFGDTCIYLHDRGDTMSGWQIEQKWEEEQNAKKQKQKDQVEAFLKAASNKKDSSNTGIIENNDGVPFACHLCRNAFTDPVVTNCGHYFCEKCLLTYFKETSQNCPICNKDTNGIFHEPTKLLSKKRKVVGRNATWQEFFDACQGNGVKNEEDE